MCLFEQVRPSPKGCDFQHVNSANNVLISAIDIKGENQMKISILNHFRVSDFSLSSYLKRNWGLFCKRQFATVIQESSEFWNFFMVSLMLWVVGFLLSLSSMSCLQGKIILVYWCMKLISSTSRFGGFGENFLLKISQRDAGGCGVGWGLGEELEAGRRQRHTVDSGGIQNFNEKNLKTWHLLTSAP